MTESLPTRLRILTLLNEHDYVSGRVLADKLGISRAGINKAVHRLQTAGVAIDAVRHRGYRLRTAVKPLQLSEIRRFQQKHQQIANFHLVEQTESTNNWLLQQFPGRLLHAQACVAECQSRGRGRRERHWYATPYQNILYSLGWYFSLSPAALSGLSLAVGIAVIRSLRHFGVSDAMLKWPNDVLHCNRKLAGILIDLRGELTGACECVIGIGINVHLQQNEYRYIDQPWVDLAALVDGLPDRNAMIAELTMELLAVLDQFSSVGLAGLVDEWQSYHAWQNESVAITVNGEELIGVATGIDDSGRLLVRSGDGVLHRYLSGAVALRAISQ